MGKSFCKVENKWCKFLKRGVCGYCKETLDSVPRCPRLTEIETVRLSDVLKEVKFEDVFEWLIYWFPDQESSKEGYESVFNSLLERKPKKHDLNDLFICVERLKDDFDPDDKDSDKEYLNVCGVKVVGNDNTRYGIEFCSWDSWVSMFITDNSFKRLSKEEIVAGCLYEMTFFGFTEEKVKDKEEQLVNSIEECKSKLKNEK